MTKFTRSGNDLETGKNNVRHYLLIRRGGAWDAWRLALEGVMGGTTTTENAVSVPQKLTDLCVAKLK
jgi:hypothetical protein